MPNTPDRARRVVVDPEGPMLVEGPVEMLTDDGTLVTSDRFMVAVCTCRRSRTYPWCDTSHRHRTRPTRDNAQDTHNTQDTKHTQEEA
ncbi:CDGSH iron-sulfur domain-containing protein [Streptomyces beijiangensis]|uniref:CDGSH iron-sulfur domain-containing protein n=1 Tax=Streptomyces beijiangensis TaxID=163361 RepID=A0A939JM60_9ACTN|nr:CDGSH iron-sulfur domain-containing protein [Streptomyces beijiangensis]MBO0517100.1 CDGSH iron-sulfur domain-containing protein [Streptomyces beijiangensis]